MQGLEITLQKAEDLANLHPNAYILQWLPQPNGVFLCITYLAYLIYLRA